jgi:hypothetical protein
MTTSAFSWGQISYVPGVLKDKKVIPSYPLICYWLAKEWGDLS